VLLIWVYIEGSEDNYINQKWEDKLDAYNVYIEKHKVYYALDRAGRHGRRGVPKEHTFGPFGADGSDSDDEGGRPHRGERGFGRLADFHGITDFLSEK